MALPGLRSSVVRHSAAAAEHAAITWSLRPCLRRFCSGRMAAAQAAATATALPHISWAQSSQHLPSNLASSSNGQANAFLARPEAIIFDKDGTLVVRELTHCVGLGGQPAPLLANAFRVMHSAGLRRHVGAQISRVR